MSFQRRRRFFLREKLLDYTMLGLSILVIIGGFGMIVFSSYYLSITKPTPYILNLFLIILGLFGLKMYQREVKD